MPEEEERKLHATALTDVFDRRLPSEQEEAATAQGAPVGLDQPAEGRLNGVSKPYGSEVDRLAMRAARREETYSGGGHSHLDINFRRGVRDSSSVILD